MIATAPAVPGAPGALAASGAAGAPGALAASGAAEVGGSAYLLRTVISLCGEGAEAINGLWSRSAPGSHSIRAALLMGQLPFHRSHLALGIMRWVFRDHSSPHR